MPAETSPSHLAAAVSLYGASPGSFEKLGAFESDVYAYDGPHGPSILKVIAPEHRTASQVQAEVDWLLALLEDGARVAEPLPSLRGDWVETWAEDSEDPRVLIGYKRAPGRLTGPGDWTDDRVEGWGEMLGRLQHHSRGWTAPGPRRKQLADQAYLRDFAEVVPEDPAFVGAAEELARQVEPLLASGANGGLIHADLHHSNLLLDGESWTAIDFDDAAYGPYAFDLAMPIYYSARSRRDKATDEAAERFLAPFLRGFRRHAPDPDAGPETISLFLRYRDAELVMALRIKLAADQWDDKLRQTEAKLRRNVGEGREVVSLEVLRRWF